MYHEKVGDIVGRLAICRAGRLGLVESITIGKGETLLQGKKIDGSNWESKDARLLSREESKTILALVPETTFGRRAVVLDDWDDDYK